MQPTILTSIVAETQTRDRIAAAADVIAAASAEPAAAAHAPEAPVAIRRARPADAPALEALAALDGRGRAFAGVAGSWAAAPELTVLLAERDSELVAAIVVASGTVLSDPFRPSAELVQLLRLRAAQLRARPRRSLPLRALARAHVLRA